MRANAHYVDQLDTPSRPVLRAVATGAIETDATVEAPERLVNSVRTHGVLEPLLVQHDPRGRQYRLIAGRRRLAAARAAGLREVPCVVHPISDADAAELIAATRDQSHPDPVRSPAPAVDSSVYPAQRELECALTSIESCSLLLNEQSVLARRGAAQVITGECRRAQRLLTAMKVLGHATPFRRMLLKPTELFARLGKAFEAEQQLTGGTTRVEVDAEPPLALYGDDDLLLTAMGSALAAITAAAGDRPRHVSFTARASGASAIAFELTDHSVVLPEAFVRSTFTGPWPVADGDALLVLLQSARAIVMAHGGSIALAAQAAGTTVRIELPAAPC